jgi:hypothetical protein
VQSFVAKFKDEFVAKGAADEARHAPPTPEAPALSTAAVTVTAHH